VPVAAPYVVKGGLKSNAKRVSSHGGICNESVGHRLSASSLPGVQERSCPLAQTQSNSSSYHGGTPITPVDSMFTFTNHDQGPIDGEQMDLDFDAIDFNQLDLNSLEMDSFANKLQTSQAGGMPVTNAMDFSPQHAYAPPTTGGFMNLGVSGLTIGMQQQKPLYAHVNPFTSVDDEPEMTLEAFDQLTGYTNGFR